MGVRHSTTRSFYFAIQGIKTAYKNEPNLRIHTFFAAFALVLAIIVKLNTLEWIILTFTLFYVITLELLNTVLESLINLVSPEIKPYAKIAKDVAAACVLLAAILSVIVGIILFLPKLVDAILVF
ncbi:MAG: Diacylglycerol kinase [Candidatus Woesebacteria bacterium GW2011_GWA1_39_8]|jgi:diacylglycerol kinase|uniref:Diacylglycerol kinase n=1 Tax=Candidatus Woesebacteria bacterium GW2011_GWA1_39_8 TaxID=1618552 RepID=A0A0G0SX39_9BACT|nr:MAG: Diacylglycerol kinase [Candidatus Woesebacteria bacterium GW2011_GWA1_39_8]